MNLFSRILGSLMILIIIAGYSGAAEPQGKIPPSLRVMPMGEKPILGDESQFIIETIITDIAEQLFYAKQHKAPDLKKLTVEALPQTYYLDQPTRYNSKVTFPDSNTVSFTLTIDGPIWSPAIYKDVTSTLAGALKLPTSKSGNDDLELLQALTSCNAVTIEKENQKLSKALESNFLDAALHERAALLIGAFTLREHSKDFFERRLPLCRMTAHLALARQFSGSPSTGFNGRIAEAMLSVLMNNQTNALAQLKALPTTNFLVARWNRTLYARCTGDYRPLDAVTNTCTLERIERFNAFARSVSTDTIWAQLTTKEKATPDFIRITRSTEYSVETGNELLVLSFPVELGEMAQVYELSRAKAVKPTELIPVLNELPERCFSSDGTLRVIGWGQWAYFFQRHFCESIERNFYFMNKQLGVPDDAREFAAKCAQQFGSLRLYPLVQLFNSTDIASYAKATAASTQLMKSFPQLIPGKCWRKFYAPTPLNGKAFKDFGLLARWYHHNFPYGTAYDSAHFQDFVFFAAPNNVLQSMHALREIAPYDTEILFNFSRFEYGNRPTYEKAADLYQAILPFSCKTMAYVADLTKENSERYEKLMVTAANLEPGLNFNLGDYFQDRRLEDKAVYYYERGIQFGHDSIRATYCSGWLIKHYLKVGNTRRAKQLADEAGEVYSSVGLEAKAEYLEAVGDYHEAFRWFQKNEERYDDSDPLIAFCVRYKEKTGKTTYDAEFQRRTPKTFPAGIEHTTISAFTSPPTDGVLIAAENDLIRNANLKMSDVIVAVYGVRVHSFEQYSIARQFSQDSMLKLIVWDGKSYREVNYDLPGHLFGVNFYTYKTGP